MARNLDIKVTVLFKGDYLAKTVHFRDKVITGR